MNTPLPKLAAPAQRALNSIKVNCLEDLSRHTAREIEDLHGMGTNALKKISDALAEAGLQFLPPET